jgi:hypothetical protein
LKEEGNREKKTIANRTRMKEKKLKKNETYKAGSMKS